jgi:hypothetical protein
MDDWSTATGIDTVLYAALSAAVWNVNVQDFDNT